MQALLIDFQDTVVDIFWNQPGQMKDKGCIFLDQCIWRILPNNPLPNTDQGDNDGSFLEVMVSHVQSYLGIVSLQVMV